MQLHCFEPQSIVTEFNDKGFCSHSYDCVFLLVYLSSSISSFSYRRMTLKESDIVLTVQDSVFCLCSLPFENVVSNLFIFLQLSSFSSPSFCFPPLRSLPPRSPFLFLSILFLSNSVLAQDGLHVPIQLRMALNL